MTQEQFSKLDKCYFKYDESQPCQQEMLEARSLLGPNRFDLYAILIYIDQKVKGVTDLSFARRIYEDRTRALTSDSFSEEGNEKKNSFESFVSVLDQLILDCQQGEYDASRTLVPVDSNYILLDGAHRTACAAYFGLKVNVLRFLDVQSPAVNYQLLISERFLSVPTADFMALESCRWHDNLFMLFLWPKAFLQPQIMDDAIQLITSKTKIMYRKEAKTSYKAIRNLMIQIYGHMDWVGNIDNDFASIYSKVDEVWDRNGRCSFLLVQADSCDFILQLKNEIRKLFNVGLASIHSTDNSRETFQAAAILFNPNSWHFIHNAEPTKFKKSFKLLERFKTNIENAHQPLDDYLVDSSMVLSMYGIREANDLDYYTLRADDSAICSTDNHIEQHDDSQKKYYRIPIADLLNCPANYFVFNEIKFVTLPRLLVFNKERYKVTSDTKHKSDMVLIENVLSGSNNQIRAYLENQKIKFYRFKRRFPSLYRNKRKEILTHLHLYDFLLSVRNTLRKL